MDDPARDSGSLDCAAPGPPEVLDRLALAVEQPGDDRVRGSINRELAALKRAFVLGRKAKLLLATDIPEVEMLKEPAGRKGFFERDQFEAVRRHLPEHLRPLISCAYLTGWRLKSELLTRTWAHVDFQANWLRLEPGETKNDEGRQFPLIPELRAALQAQWEYTQQCQKALPVHHSIT